MALSFQIVLVQQEATSVVPKNLAVALNEECTRCDSAVADRVDQILAREVRRVGPDGAPGTIEDRRSRHVGEKGPQQSTTSSPFAAA